MKLSDLSIKRPVLAVVMSLLLVVLGVMSFNRLTLRELPAIDPPIVSVSVDYTGASAAVIESRITQVLEDALAGKLPFHLIHKDCTDLLKEQLRQEIKRRKWDARKESMEPEKERFIASFFKAAEPAITPPLEDGQMDAVLGQIGRAHV